jgi:hypothetical protein
LLLHIFLLLLSAAETVDEHSGNDEPGNCNVGISDL